MAHMFETGAFAKVGAWHGLGTVVADLMTAAEALEAGGLNWTVEKKEMTVKCGDSDIVVPNHVATVRNTDNAVLGVVGDGYEVLQNAEALDFLDTVVQTGAAKYDSVGSLRGGRKVFLSAKLPGTIKVSGVAGDQIEKYLLLSTSHDGTSHLRMLFTPVRVVCNNTLTMALAGAQNAVAIRHTRNMKSKVEAARKALHIANDYYDSLDEVTKAMVGTRMTEEDMREFVAALLPATGSEESTRLSNNRAKVFELFESGRGQEGEVRGTVWAAYNAATEYVDHHQSTRVTAGNTERDLRADSVLFGAGFKLKQRAFDLLSARIGQ